MNERKQRFKKGDVIVVQERPAYISRIGGDNGDTSTIHYEFINSDMGVPCDAGGPPEKQGHVFNIEWESEDRLSSGYMCQCGLDNSTFSIRNDQ